MTVFLASIFVALLVICARWFKPREGYVSSVVFFGIGCFAFNVAFPTQLALADDPWAFIPGVGRLIEIPPAYQQAIVLCSILGLGFFAVGYRLSGFRPLGNYPTQASQRTPRSIIITGTLALAVLAFFWRDTYSFWGYQASGSRYENPLLVHLMWIVVVSFTLVASEAFARTPLSLARGCVFMAPAIALGLFWGDKNPLLLAMLAPASYLLVRRSGSLFLWPGYVACFLMLLLAVQAFSIYRAGVRPRWDQLELSMSRTDPAGPMVSLVDSLRMNSEPELGATYLFHFILLIPKAIWPNRPLDLSEAYARVVHSQWAPGQGTGFSFLAEAFLNFGWAGAIIQYFLFGLTWGWGWRWISKRVRPLGLTYFYAMYSTLGFNSLLLVHRGPWSALTKEVVITIAPFILAQVIITWTASPTSVPQQQAALRAPAAAPGP